MTSLPSSPEDAARRQAAAEVMERILQRTGVPSIEHYRKVYASLGEPWPGDDEIRRLYPVASVA